MEVEVNSLAIIILAIAVGLIVGFEIGMNEMRKRVTKIVEKATEETRKELERKRKAQEEAKAEAQKNLEKLAKSWKDIFEKSKKEQKENGIQSDANDQTGSEIRKTPGYLGKGEQ